MTVLEIREDETINELKDNFSAHFPHLKLEFYSKEHEEGEGSLKDYIIHGDKTLKEVRTVHKEGVLSIHGNVKVSTLENDFKDLYGLNVQVFRKSGSVWLQTTKTDEWTLSEQEKEALEFER